MQSNYYINKSISKSNMSHIVASVSRSYEAVEIMKMEFSILRGPMLSNVVSDLRQALVQHEIIRMIDNKLLDGLSYRVSNTSKNNYPFLEIFNNSFLATVSHVQTNIQIPRKAIYRNERAVSNQLSLFPEDNIDFNKLYFIITHGHNGAKPDFICIGLPDEKNEYWQERINILDIKQLSPSKKEQEDSLVTLTQYAKEVLKIENKVK